MKIYQQAKDLNIVATCVYNNGDDYAYVDAECTKKFKSSELKEAFVKGSLINIDGDLFKAVGFTTGENGVGIINFVMANGEAGVVIGGLEAEADE